MQSTELTVVEVIEINPPEPNPALREKGKPFLCRHIFVDGRRCGSPAIRAEHFCYYHRTHRTPVLGNPNRKHPKSGFHLMCLDGLDNPAAVQLALTKVLAQIAENRIDAKRGGLLLYGLQIAGRNLRRCPPVQAPVPDAIVDDGIYGQLAEAEEGREEPVSIPQRMRDVLDITKPDTDFYIPEDCEEIFADLRASRKEMLAAAAGSPTGSPLPSIL